MYLFVLLEFKNRGCVDDLFILKKMFFVEVVQSYVNNTLAYTEDCHPYELPILWLIVCIYYIFMYIRSGLLVCGYPFHPPGCRILDLMCRYMIVYTNFISFR